CSYSSRRRRRHALFTRVLRARAVLNFTRPARAAMVARFISVRQPVRATTRFSRRRAELDLRADQTQVAALHATWGEWSKLLAAHRGQPTRRHVRRRARPQHLPQDPG